MSAEFEEIFESCGGDEEDARAALFEEGIGANGGAVEDVCWGGVETCRLECGADPLDNSASGVIGCGRAFVDHELSIHFEEDIGEGPSGVYRNSHSTAFTSRKCRA